MMKKMRMMRGGKKSGRYQLTVRIDNNEDSWGGIWLKSAGRQRHELI